MTDSYEDELRSRLREATQGAGAPVSPAGRVDTEQLLARVHAGARRRRTRRAAAAAVAATAAVAAGIAVVPTLLPGPGTPVAGTDPGSTVSDAAATTVAATGDTVWATVRGRCGTADCRALARSDDGGASWSFTTTADTDTDTDAALAGLPATADHVAVASTAGDGWAWTERGELASTHDGGGSWGPVPGTPAVRELVAGSEHAVALVGDATSLRVLATPVSGDTWRDVEAPVGAGDNVYGLFADGDTYGAVVDGSGPQALVVGAGDASWQRRDLPCGGQSPVYADAGGATLWAACLGGATTTVSHTDVDAAVAGSEGDRGETMSPDSSDSSVGSADGWATVQLPPLRGRVTMTVSADESVLLAGAGAAYRVTAGSGSQRVDPPGDGGESSTAVLPGSGGNPLDTALGGFGDAASGDDTWLVSTDGTLVSSSDDGRSWHRVPVS